MKDNYFFNFNKLSYIRGEKASGCILCKIKEKNPEVPNLTIFENDIFIVSLNLYPYNPGHLLIFPKAHIEDIRDYTEKQELNLARITKYFLTILDETHKPAAYNIGYNMGPVAGASIAHLHLHIIPRYPQETGIADLIAGKRVLVEDPRETLKKIMKAVDQRPFSSSAI